MSERPDYSKVSYKTLHVLSKFIRSSGASTSSEPPTIADTENTCRMTEDMKQILLEKEADVEKDRQAIGNKRRSIDMFYDIIERRQNLIPMKRQEITEAEDWIRKTEAYVRKSELELWKQTHEVEKKKAWVASQKRNYPYQFPEWQIKD